MGWGRFMSELVYETETFSLTLQELGGGERSRMFCVCVCVYVITETPGPSPGLRLALFAAAVAFTFQGVVIAHHVNYHHQ